MNHAHCYLSATSIVICPQRPYLSVRGEVVDAINVFLGNANRETRFHVDFNTSSLHLLRPRGQMESETDARMWRVLAWCAFLEQTKFDSYREGREAI